MILAGDSQKVRYMRKFVTDRIYLYINIILSLIAATMDGQNLSLY
jgi:hypothetical protein